MQPETDKNRLHFCPKSDMLLSENVQKMQVKMSENSQNSPLIINEKQGIPVYSSNPSVPPPDGLARRRQKRMGSEEKGLIIDGGSGEILGRGTAVVYEWEEVDKERFVKLFIGGIKKASGLSKTGLGLFEAVYHQMRNHPNSDQVQMSLWMAAQHIKGLNERTYRRGLRELLEREVLYRSPFEGTFFVDINCMFNGDRLAFVKGYKIKKDQPTLPGLGLSSGESLPAPESEKSE